MSVSGQAKKTQSKKTFDRVRSGRQSPAQKKLEEKTLTYGPYVLGGVGGLGLKAIVGLLAGKTLAKGATKAGLKKAAEKFYGKKAVNTAMNPTQAARNKALRKDNVSDAVPPKTSPKTTSTTKTNVKKKDPPKTNAKKKETAKNKKSTTTDNVSPAVLGGVATAGTVGAIALANSDKVGTRNDLANFQANRRTDRQDGSSRTKRGKDAQNAKDVLEVTSAKMAKEDKDKKVNKGDGVDRSDLSAPTKKDKTPPKPKPNPRTKTGTGDPSSAPNKTKTKATPIVDDDKKAKNKPKRSVVKDSDRLGVKIARMLGDERSSSQMVKDRIENEKLEEEMNFRKGGMPKYKKGGMAKAFGKGGMYKGGKKTYGMKYGGFTRRGMGK